MSSSSFWTNASYSPESSQSVSKARNTPLKKAIRSTSAPDNATLSGGTSRLQSMQWMGLYESAAMSLRGGFPSHAQSSSFGVGKGGSSFPYFPNPKGSRGSIISTLT